MAEIKQLQLLRSAAAYADFATAKTKLGEKLAETTVKDGEIITASYVKGEGDAAKVHTLFAIKRTDATGATKAGESYFQDIEATAEEIQSAVKKITEGEGAVSSNSLKAAIEAETTRATAAEQANADAIAKLNGADNVVGSVAKSIKDAVEALDVTDTAVGGQFVTAVSETDGKVVISRGTVASNQVTAETVTAGTDTVAIEGTNVDAQIKSLGKTLKTVESNAAKYEVEEVTVDLPANVKTRYQVVSYVGTKTDTNKTKVGEFIDIPKDGQLRNVEVTKNAKGEPTVVKFTYDLGDGAAAKAVEVDLGKAIFESEVGDGLQVDTATGVISIKKDTASENFLTVGANGVKLAGVQDAIDAAKTAATDAINALDLTAVGGAGKFVQSVSQENGQIAATAADLNAEAVALAEIREADGVENPASLGRENDTVQKGIQALFVEMLKNEKVSAAAKAALITVLGSHAVNGETFKVEYTGDGSDIIKGATSFSDADERLAAAIATLNATKVIDCGTY